MKVRTQSNGRSSSVVPSRITRHRSQLFTSAYNLANFLWRLALPCDVQHWSLATLREKCVEIGAKVTRNSKYLTFQHAEVAVTQRLFAAIVAAVVFIAFCREGGAAWALARDASASEVLGDDQMNKASGS